MENWINDRVLGAMMGGAIGDALGFPVESCSYDDIVSEFGTEGITRFKLNENGCAVFSDDIQMMLFTTNGILLGLSQSVVSNNVIAIEKYVEIAYMEWIATQLHRWTDVKTVPVVCWLSRVRDLYVSRLSPASSMTILKVLEHQGEIVDEKCEYGGLARVAPVGLFAALHSEWFDDVETIRLGVKIARMTRKAALDILSAGLFSFLLRKIVSNKKLDANNFIQDIECGIDLLSHFYPKETVNIAYLKMILSRAIYLSTQVIDDVEAIKSIGEGRGTEEILGIAIYCVLRHWGDYEKTVIAAVNHSGDSDSVGAVAGNLAGAIVGNGAIPLYYKDRLELIDVIQEITADLINGFPDWHRGMTPEMSAWMQKYRDAIWPAYITLKCTDFS